MNILFVLYGDFGSNSANPLALYARELKLRGHDCAVAVPSGLETVSQHDHVGFRPVLYGDALAAPLSLFPDGRPADVLHACTPREVVRRFVGSYMARRPTPLVICLEDNECWIALQALGVDKNALYQLTDYEISEKLPNALAHPFFYRSFVGLADAAVVVQDKLRCMVPPWVPCETVMIGVDLSFFSPRLPDPSARRKYGVAENEKIIVYHGGLNQFTRPGIESLCTAIGLVNSQGYPCRLLRTGPVALSFLEQWPHGTASAIRDLGVVPRSQLPALLALGDVFVQPGTIDPFEDLRLPGKVPEFLAMGRPVIMPDVNISHLFRDGVDAVLLRTGSAEEIAEKCIDLFSNPQRAWEIGQAGRRFAEKYFDFRYQAGLLEGLYKSVRDQFDPKVSMETWVEGNESTPTTLRLARRLELLAALRAKRELEPGVILAEHARYLEFMQRRIDGLQAAITQRDFAETDAQVLSLKQKVAQRDRQVAELKEAVDGFLNSRSWRLTMPLRKAKALAAKARERLNSLWSI